MATPTNIILFPYLAQGHIIPFLDLAKILENQIQRFSCMSITLLSTPLNIENLRPLLPSNSKIHLRSISFDPTSHGLPPHVENTDACPSPSHIMNVMHASGSLEPQFEQFITQQFRSDPHLKLYLITDVFVCWTVPIAKKFSIPHVVFTTCGALGTAAYMSMWLNLPHRQTDEEYFQVPGFPDSFRLHRSQMSYANRVSDGTDKSYKYLCRQIRFSMQSDLMICNTVEELEPLGLQVLKVVTGKSNIYTIGPLVLLQEEKSQHRVVEKLGIKPETCLQWLDTQAEHSVVYICFGSQSTITAAHMLTLAEGLESSGIPFVWVIRPPTGIEKYDNTEINEDDEKQQVQKWLPQGFIERITCTKQGLLVWGWSPQLEILTHTATGAFFSHCGWDSTLESLSRGVPLIGWPLAAEQFFNAKMLEELGVLVEINRGIERELESREVERVVKEVISGEKGKELRSKTAVCKEILRNAMAKNEETGEKGSSLRSLHELVDFFIKR